MITNLETIRQLGEKNLNANYRFRSLLKGKDSERLDNTVHDLFEFYSSKIDCTSCGNCCTKLKPTIKTSDLKVLARTTNKITKEFKNEFVELDENGEMQFNNLPCPFLLNKKCTIYSSRPNDCKSYPHLHKKDFLSRLYGIIEYYSICPIVFNVFEELKYKFHFR
jgi:Fe-S-cluster containining protein